MNVKTVYIEITNRCNFNCRTCYNRSGLNRQTDELSIKQIEEIFEFLSAYGANRFLISGGEPTLHSEFDALIDLIDAYPKYSFGFVTNGSSRNQKFIDLLNRNNNLTLQISLDGSCEERNALTRGRGHFEPTIDFIKMINNNSLRPLLKMVVSQCNLDDVENFYRLAVSLNCVPEFAFIYKSGNGEEDWEKKRVSAQDKLKILKLIDKLNSQYQIEAYLPKCTSRCPFSKGAENMSVCIKVDGSIQPCQTLYSSDYTLGNVFSSSEEEILHNLSQIIHLAQKRTTEDYGCSKCILRDICGKGCMAEASLISGDPLGADESCLYRKLQFLNFDILKEQKNDSN